MLYIFIILFIFISDTIIKKFIEDNKEYGKEEEFLGGHIIINKYHNKGGMLNFLEQKKEFVKIFSCILFGVLLMILAIIIPKKGNKLLKLGLALTIGGATSNIYDRISKGYVVDYISFKKIKNVVFNISDFAIFIGALLVGLASLIKKD